MTIGIFLSILLYIVQAFGSQAGAKRVAACSKNHSDQGHVRWPDKYGHKDYGHAVCETHNQLRAGHHAGGLHWNATLANYAKPHAQSCDFEHDLSRGQGDYGQNIYMNSGPGALGAIDISDIITKHWYDEVHDFETMGLYNAPSVTGPAFEKIGHFTQIVWNDTTAIGCFTADCSKDSTHNYVTVCNYSPAGNMEGSFAKNVLKI